MDHGYAVRLVNTTTILQYDSLKHGDVHTDTLHLAQLMRLGSLSERYIYPPRATRHAGSVAPSLQPGAAGGG